jgi:hypothetical protein
MTSDPGRFNSERWKINKHSLLSFHGTGLRNPAYLVRPPFARTRGRLPRPFPISKFCQIPALSPFGRGNSRET